MHVHFRNVFSGPRIMALLKYLRVSNQRARNSFTILYSLLEISIKSYNLFQFYNLSTKIFRVIPYTVFLNKISHAITSKIKCTDCYNWSDAWPRVSTFLAAASNRHSLISSSTEQNYEWLQAVIIVIDSIYIDSRGRVAPRIGNHRSSHPYSAPNSVGGIRLKLRNL